MEQKNKYQNGKIYTIRSPHTDKFYIGSTCNPLSKRFWNHKNGKENTTSKIIINFGDAYIELLEKYSCKDRDELNRREGELIRLHKNICVNHVIPYRSDKQYKIDNKELIQQKRKEHYEKNKENLKQKQKEYYKQKCLKESKLF
jgi:hypothetical protein